MAEDSTVLYTEMHVFLWEILYIVIIINVNNIFQRKEKREDVLSNGVQLKYQGFRRNCIIKHSIPKNCVILKIICLQFKIKSSSLLSLPILCVFTHNISSTTVRTGVKKVSHTGTRCGKNSPPQKR